MERSVINVSPRSGKKPHVMRKEGFVPISLSRNGEESLIYQAEYNELKRALGRSGGSGLIELNEEGPKSKKHIAITRHVQRDYSSLKVIAVSFQEVTSKQVIHVTVPLILNGTPSAVSDKSGNLLQMLNEVEVQAPATDLPNHLEYDISNMNVGDVITIGQIEVSDKYKIITHADTPFVTLSHPNIRADEDEAKPAAAETPADPAEAAE